MWGTPLGQAEQLMTGLRQAEQWLTAPRKPKPSQHDISKEFIFDAASLVEAARHLGLDRSEELMGNLDAVTREASGARISGWAFDTARTPVTVYLFRGGQMILKTTPKGKRPDVATAYPWAPQAAGDVKFEGLIQCQPGDLMIVALLSSDGGRYNWVKSPQCP
jgi:hypothetical protein